jgi:hypothetical protein
MSGENKSSDATSADMSAPDAARIQAAVQAMEGGTDESSAVEAGNAGTQEGEAVEQEQAPGGADPKESESPEQDAPGELESSKLAERARRDRERRERRQKQQAEMDRRAAELDAREEALKTRGGSLDEWLTKFRQRPEEALKQVGLEDSLGDIANLLYAVELGEDAPPELLAKLRARETETRLERIERENRERLAEIEQREQAAKHEEFQRKYVGAIDSHMRELPEDMVYARAVYSKNPEKTLEVMYATAVEIAQEDPKAPVATPAELARRLDEQLQEELEPIIRALIELQLGHEKESEAAKEPTADQTLRNAHTASTRRVPAAETEEERIRRAMAALDSE